MSLKELLRFYEKHTGASISIEVKNGAFLQWPALKLAPDQYLHHTEFCRQNKLRDHTFSCSKNKRRSLLIAAKGRSFSGFCPYGFWEYASPVMFRGELAAVVYLGFREKITPEKRRVVAKKAAFIVEYINIELTRYIENGGGCKQHKDAFYVENCRTYIASHYLEDIVLTDLAELLRVNPDYLGLLIKRKTGQTFREILTQKRVDESKIYLKLHPNRTITEISRLCGFNDSNYYSTVFRKLTGVSPRGYRQSN